MSRYTRIRLFRRRISALLLGILLFPLVVWVPRWRRRSYSYLHRLWLKRSDEPVWLMRNRCMEKRGL
ncbi:MAG: YbfA family protein [Aeromonadaceae bacterium]|nr:YbfA family protein [Aeromonadaceae bacterium]